jgi:hypothetical protein
MPNPSTQTRNAHVSGEQAANALAGLTDRVDTLKIFLSLFSTAF